MGGIAIARFGVSGAAQLIGDAIGCEVLAQLYRLRGGVDLGRVGENWPIQALVDDPLILNIVVRKDSEQDHAYDDESGNGRFDGRMGESLVNPLAAWNFKFNCQCGDCYLID